MSGDVRLRDGIELDLSDGTRVVFDADDPDGDVNVLSHAHGDHLFETDAPPPLVCSPLTAALARVRRPDATLERTTHPYVDLVNAGHIPGSRAALVTDPDGTRYLYTGDVSTRDRLYLDGFDPVSADVLIVEATYGEPEYVFPPQSTIQAAIRDWLDATEPPVLLFGYALGRAQMLQVLAQRAGRDRVFVTDAIARLNRPIADTLDVTLDARPYDEAVTLAAGDAFVLPSQFTRHDWVASIQDATGAVKAGFSGWATDTGFEYQGAYDETFVLSDHCDFEELRALVRAVDPDRVYTQHGAADTLTTHLEADGYTARTLKPNQTALGDF